jgi:subtilisin family serine protease
VIAVGASALDDGEPDGSNHTGGTATNPVEYVASYSDYGSPAAAFRSTSAWGIVAPGGDPADSEAQVNAVTYDWHWIENIWTSTPYMANSGDQTFQGNCAADYGATTVQTADCRTLIAGTSMATPHVGGVAALILSATGGSSSPYQSPAEMKQLLCESTDDIGDPHEGCGRLNVYRAMALALGDPTAP